MHPAHVPLMCESETAVFYRMRYLRPGRGLLGDEHRIRVFLADDAVQMLEELDSFKVLIAAVLVRDILLSSVVPVEHRRYGINTDTVEMVLVEPVYDVGDEE